MGYIVVTAKATTLDEAVDLLGAQVDRWRADGYEYVGGVAIARWDNTKDRRGLLEEDTVWHVAQALDSAVEDKKGS